MTRDKEWVSSEMDLSLSFMELSCFKKHGDKRLMFWRLPHSGDLAEQHDDIQFQLSYFRNKNWKYRKKKTAEAGCHTTHVRSTSLNKYNMTHILQRGIYCFIVFNKDKDGEWLHFVASYIKSIAVNTKGIMTEKRYTESEKIYLCQVNN